MTWNKTKDFLNLRNEWYAKLTEQGFQDIEKALDNGEMSALLTPSIRCSSKGVTEEVENVASFLHRSNAYKAEYYRRYYQHALVLADTFGDHVHFESCALLADGFAVADVARGIGRTWPYTQKITKGYEHTNWGKHIS